MTWYNFITGTKRKEQDLSSDDDDNVITDNNDKNNNNNENNKNSEHDIILSLSHIIDDRDDSLISIQNDSTDKKKFDVQNATLHQLLTKLISDADITCPNVIVVGQQSSGKTKMIINMVFHHLINNEHVTDAIGIKLLEIFRTGKNHRTVVVVLFYFTSLCYYVMYCGMLSLLLLCCIHC